MSVNDNFKALLQAAPGVLAIVGPRGVAMHEVPAGTRPPYIVFTSETTPEHTLSGPTDDGIVTLYCTCWAAKAHLAEALADAVIAACEAHDLTSTAESVTVTARAPEFDAELQLDFVALTIEWWP